MRQLSLLSLESSSPLKYPGAETPPPKLCLHFLGHTNKYSIHTLLFSLPKNLSIVTNSPHKTSRKTQYSFKYCEFSDSKVHTEAGAKLSLVSDSSMTFSKLGPCSLGSVPSTQEARALWLLPL